MNDVFDNKNALILGGGNGIGQAIALEFARRGARIAVADIDEAAAKQTADEIERDNGTAIALCCDVTDSESLEVTIESAAASLDGIDIVVNNVGVIVSGNPQDIPLGEWQRIIDINLFSVLRSNEIILPRMLRRGTGYIVNTASFAGLYPYATNRMPYSASKAAIISLSESLALYLEPKGIRVSCFCPGPVMTAVMKNMRSWSEDAVMSGPGSQFDLISAEQAAVTLAVGMQQGRIVIPTHEAVFEEIRRHADDPDQFIRDKAAEISLGELGLPKR